jgi:hypothetical protein
MPDPNPEVTAIDAAYGAQVQALFKNLVLNLADEPASYQTDRQSVDKFATGLKIAQRARQLALSVVVSASGGAVSRRGRTAASRRTKNKDKQTL